MAALAGSGALSIGDIATQWGRSLSNVSFGAYIKGGSIVTTDDYVPNVPTSTPNISVDNFHGAAKSTVTAVRYPSTEGDSGSWSGPGNIFADDTNYAISPSCSAGQTPWIQGGTFGFDALIPGGATVDVITWTLVMKLGATGAQTHHESIQIFSGATAKYGYTWVGSGVNDGFFYAYSAYLYAASYGITRTDLLDANMVMRYALWNDSGAYTMDTTVDYMTMKVSYH